MTQLTWQTLNSDVTFRPLKYCATVHLMFKELMSLRTVLYSIWHWALMQRGRPERIRLPWLWYLRPKPALNTRIMDEWTIKTPNFICRLFFSFDLWPVNGICGNVFNIRFYRLEIHSLIGWYFQPSLWTVAPQWRRNYTRELLPLYLLSVLPPPHLPK